MLAQAGLAEAIRVIALRSADAATVAKASEPEIEGARYYCCVEAIQNATKHAGPDAHTSIRLTADANELRLEVRDGGAGFDVASPTEGVGLQSMRDRLGAVGGRIEVVSEPDRATLVTAVVPLGEPPAIDLPA